MGLQLARQAGLAIITRAKGHNFLVFNGIENIIFDAVPDHLHAQKPRVVAAQT